MAADLTATAPPGPAVAAAPGAPRPARWSRERPSTISRTIAEPPPPTARTSGSAGTGSTVRTSRRCTPSRTTAQRHRSRRTPHRAAKRDRIRVGSTGRADRTPPLRHRRTARSTRCTSRCPCTPARPCLQPMFGRHHLHRPSGHNRPVATGLGARRPAASLENVPLPGHDHLLTTRNGDQPEWWNVIVIPVTSPTAWPRWRAPRAMPRSRPWRTSREAASVSTGLARSRPMPTCGSRPCPVEAPRHRGRPRPTA